MRIWTINPKYLDPQGLVALWRETLLAKKILEGGTRGYTSHPQLIRFRETSNPLKMINSYLFWVYDESLKRGYSFDRGKFDYIPLEGAMEETEGQLLFEWEHLLKKLRIRNIDYYNRHRKVPYPDPNPLFKIIPGGRAFWEKG